MPPAMSVHTKRWLAGVRSSWPQLLIALIAAFLIGYHLAPRTLQPLTPPFAFTNGTSTIEARGAWHTSGASTPNATNIFCWLPVGSCDVTVADLVPAGTHSRLQLNG